MNEDSIGQLNSENVVSKAHGINKDVETNTGSLSMPDYIGLGQTANLPGKLKLCVGAIIMLTDKMSFSDRLINTSIIN